MLHALLDVLLVVQSSYRSPHRYSIDVERHAQAADVLGQFLVGDAIAYPQAAQPVDLGKSADGHDVASFPNIGQGVGQEFRVGVLPVGLVNDHQHAGRDLSQEIVQLVPVNQCACGIVGIAEEDQPRAVGDAVQHPGQIVGEIVLQVYEDALASADIDHDFVQHESGRADDGLVPFLAEKGPRDHAQHIARAIAGDETLLTQAAIAQSAGQFGPQLVIGHGRITVDVSQRLLHRLHSQRRRAQSILVGSQLAYLLQTILALDFLNGGASYVQLR